MEFQKTPGWLDWYPGPSRPRFKVPPGAVDAHCHVFGPGAEFPYAPERKYTPCDASKQQLFALRDHLGFARNVIVQATCHGADNRAMIDALLHSDGKARGIATVKRSGSDAELRPMHDAGVRGVRFNFVKRLVDFTPREELIEITGRIEKLGWHVVIYFEAVDLPELWDFFTSLPTTVVVDHMGRPDVSKPVDGPEFELFVKFMRDHPNVWSKVSCPERLSIAGPPALNGEQNAYRDVVPFARRIVETVIGTLTTASPKRGIVPRWSLTPVANVLSSTSIFRKTPSYSTGLSFGFWTRSFTSIRISSPSEGIDSMSATVTCTGSRPGIPAHAASVNAARRQVVALTAPQ